MAKMKRRTFLKGGAMVAVSAGAARADDFALGLLPGTRYPDPRIEVLDKRFTGKIGNAGIERIMTGLRWAEGPCWSGEGHYLLVSDVAGDRMMRSIPALPMALNRLSSTSMRGSG